jgi:DNA polymerase theta
MSATLPNLKDLAKWLQARLYVTNYRPVELVEFIKVLNVVYDKAGNPVRKIQADQKVAVKMGDPDYLIPIVFEVISTGHSCLVFCSTKRECENACKNLSRLMQNDNGYLPKELIEQRNALVHDLKQSPAGLDPVLAISIRNGFGYHHSGLLIEERLLLEDAFRNGIVNCICATSTLASGVNLPARRVIFRSPYISWNFLCSKEYKQMSGRAGRKGKDTFGESIIMCEQKDFEKCKELVLAKHKPLESCLGEMECLKRAILEVIASRIVKSPDDLAAYIQKTLLYHHSSLTREKAMKSALDIIQFLILNDFMDFKDGEYIPFRLANATLASSLSPEEALFVSREIKRDIGKFCLLDDFHVIYHCTPAYFNQINHKWERMRDLFGVLEGSYLSVAQNINISVGYLHKLSLGGRIVDDDRYLTHVRFFNALIVNDLISEVPINKLLEKYDMGTAGRGAIQSLQTLASSYCGMVRLFCERMGLKNLAVLIGLNQDRLAFGVEAEILALAKIPGFDRTKSRLLYNAGYKTPLSISKAGYGELFLILKEDGLGLPDNFYKKSAGKLLLAAQAYLESF